MRKNYASSYAGGGLLGAVVIDTMGEFVPPKRRRMPNGTIREVPRHEVCYLSNLAVAPCTRRSGVGRRLLAEAEALAASWGCRSMALHVDPTNTAAIKMYERAGYRKIADQPECQRIMEQREHPLALYMRALPWEARQAAKRAAAAGQGQAAGAAGA
jgi:ribosomal protein S18 acetylase RimI-like enzyme